MAAGRLRLAAAMELLSPKVRAAFGKAVEQAASRVDEAALAQAVADNDFEAALEALNLSEDAMDVLREELRGAVRFGGMLENSVWSSVSRAIFSQGNVRAANIARSRSGQLIAEVLEQTRQAARAVIADSIQSGLNPNIAARAVAGKVRAGKLTGGIIGLRQKDAAAALKMKRELENLDSSYFKRKLRDKRYDSRIRRAMKSGKPLDAQYVRRAMERYKDRMRRHRGQVIAQTETLAALNAGRYEYAEQLVDSGEALPSEITLTWMDSYDALVRDSHRAMRGAETKFGEPFAFPGGSRARFPGDSSLNADPRYIIGCRCHFKIEVDWGAVRRRRINERRAAA